MNLTDDDFEHNITTSTTPILVEFGAQWCSPCSKLAAILNQVEKELRGKIKICRMDIEDSPDIPSRFGIRSIPTMMLFKEGKKLGTKAGVDSKEAIIDWINDLQENS